MWLSLTLILIFLLISSWLTDLLGYWPAALILPLTLKNWLGLGLLLLLFSWILGD